MKPWEYYDNYIGMTLKAGDETRDMEWLFLEIEDEGISAASEFAAYVDAVIKQGVPEDNEKEVAVQALLMFLCEHLGENFVEDEFEADSFSISFEGEVLYTATCAEYVEYCESKGWI
ncbi:MAG: hypothetical protein J6C15_07810 [Bacteroidaceae bacterium]|nr:hypothetical protein [Bacteroidaceae bacterium]